MSRKYFILCLICALWTIIQTSFHLVFVIYSYFLSICQRTPTDANSIFFYLTYLYTKDCSLPTLQTATYKSTVLNIINNIYFSDNTTLDLEELVRELLENVEFFPSSALASSRTSVFLLCFIILDGTWIVSAVALLMGICCGIKESSSLVFYGPWLVFTLCVAIFDATATVLFGYDIAETLTFSSWRKFVGISDSANFTGFDSRDISRFLTAGPALTLSSVSSRFILIWISNWICFIFVMKATISVYRESYNNERASRPVELPSSHKQVDPNTSAARIRSWQLFYGTTDTTSSRSSKSIESEKDLNSNTKEGIENSDVFSPNSGNYKAYPDVADSVTVNLQLRGQLPWTYIQASQGKVIGQENFELQNRRHHRLKSDSSGSGTEL